MWKGTERKTMKCKYPFKNKNKHFEGKLSLGKKRFRIHLNMF